MTVCPRGCTCRRHRERTAEENAAHGAAISAAAQRRHRWESEQVWQRSHRRCLQCGRLLVPEVDGKPPQHRIPARPGQLTGVGAPWCKSRYFA